MPYVDLTKRTPEWVAQDLDGAPLLCGTRVCLIRSLQVRSAEHCKRYASKPLFQENPPDVMVAAYLNHHLLFIRTAGGSCVQLNEIEFQGANIVGPGKVCAALGLTQERTGRVVYDGTAVVLVLE